MNNNYRKISNHNLKSACTEISLLTNITKWYVSNTYDSYNTDINTPLNVIHVHVYIDYVISFWMYVHSTLCVYTRSLALVNDICRSWAYA